jgi:hypothetical protein
MILVSASVLSIARGAKLWAHALTKLPERLHRTTANFPMPPRSKNRMLQSYLLLPRNQEELLKGLFIPICVVIGRILAPGIPAWRWGVQDWDGSRSSFWHVVLFFLVFEFLVYQARYLLNDVRDRYIDSGKKLSKERFPSAWLDRDKKEEFALKAALGSLLARVMLAGLLVGCILPFKNLMWAWHAGFLLGVFLIAGLYETVKNKCNVVPESRLTFWSEALTAVVGAGYGLRSAVGLWLAGIDDIGALSLVALGGSLFGSMFVSLTWALESSRADAKEFVAKKAYLAWFRSKVVQAAKRSHISVKPRQKVLARRQLLNAPWCVTAVFSTMALVAFALYLFRIHLTVGQMVLVAASVIGIAAVTVVTPLKIACYLTYLNVVGLFVMFRYFSATNVKSVTATLVVSLPLIVTCIFRNMCFEDLPGIMNKVGKIIGAAWELLFSWFKKERKSEALAPSSTPASPGQR